MADRRLRHTAAVAVASVLLVTACTNDPAPTRPSRPAATTTRAAADTATVTADGVRATTGPLTVSAGPAVAAAGTSLTLLPFTPPKVAFAQVQTLAAVDVRLGDQLQPAAPVTVTADVRTIASGQYPVLLTRHGNAQWQATVMTVSGGKATATLKHLSPAWVVFLDQHLIDPITTFFDTVLEQRYPAPSCAGKPATVDGTTYTPQVSGKGLHVCAADAGQGKVRLTVSSNSPWVWRLRPAAGAGQQGIAPLTTAGVVTQTVYDVSMHSQFEKETAVVPGGNADILIPTGKVSTLARADIDPVLGYVAIIVAGVDILLSTRSAALKAAERIAAGECIASALEAGVSDASVSERVGLIVKAALTCLKAAASGPAAVLLSLIQTLSSLLVTQLNGLVSEIRGDTHLTVALIASGGPSAAGSVQLGDRGTVTRRILVNLIGADARPKSAYAVDPNSGSGVIDCSYDRGSPVAVSRGTHQCGDTADNAFACWPALAFDGPPGLACLPDPWTNRYYWRSLNAPLAQTKAPKDPAPFGVELDDGSRWFYRVGGAWGVGAEGAVPIYGCSSRCPEAVTPDGHALLWPTHSTKGATTTSSGLIRRGDDWFAWRGPMGSSGEHLPPATLQHIAKIWFITI